MRQEVAETEVWTEWEIQKGNGNGSIAVKVF